MSGFLGYGRGMSDSASGTPLTGDGYAERQRALRELLNAMQADGSGPFATAPTSARRRAQAAATKAGYALGTAAGTARNVATAIRRLPVESHITLATAVVYGTVAVVSSKKSKAHVASGNAKKAVKTAVGSLVASQEAGKVIALWVKDVQREMRSL